MINFIKRDKNDIFNKPILGFLFKNPKFLLTLRIVVTALFFYALYFGFTNPTNEENTFTTAVFWGVFWSLFIVVTLPTFGRIFCGICPHGFLGKHITKFGLKKTMPNWMQNRYIGITILVIGWWGVYYTFDGFFKSPFNTAAMFAILTILAFIIYYLYKDMSYCKFICPIGTLTRAYDKLSFTKLDTYTDSCKDCRTFECASACQYDLKPFSFAKKNQTDDCTLCMDCANACEAVAFKFTKPAEQLGSKLKVLNAEIWAYILILASIPISMGFAHGLNRSKIADEFIWNKTAEFFGLSQYTGGFAFLYAVAISSILAVGGLYLASKILKKDYSSTFTTLGVAFIPLFIFASLGHTLETFFTKEYKMIVEGFAQGFGLSAEVENLAKRGDGWLHYFSLFKWIGIVWALILLYKRMKLIDSTKLRKIFGYFLASFLILFYIGLNIYTGYVFAKYGAKERGGHGGHSEHSSGEMFQTVSFKDATLLQSGKDKNSGIVCGMNLAQYYKTNHSATLDGKVRQYCSIHCLVEDLNIKKLPLQNIQVVDVSTLKFIDVKDAVYVVGSSKQGTMTTKSQYAFGSKKDAYKFRKEFGGDIVDFIRAVEIAMEDFGGEKKSFKKEAKPIEPDEPIYFSLKNPKEERGKKDGMHSHGGGKPQAKGEIPTKNVWLLYGKKNLFEDENLTSFAFDTTQSLKDLQVENKMGMQTFSFEVPKNGYYNLFAISSSTIDKKEFYKVAKLEYLHGKHGAEELYNENVKKEVQTNKSKIDLIRTKSKEEDSFFYTLKMGETLTFKAYLDGKPIEDGKIDVRLGSGWSKRLKTDENGTVSFVIPRDYFPNWNEFDKRYKQDMLITLKYSDENTEYILTYPASYYPNSSDYESYGYGLILFFSAFLIGGFAIYRYRKNRTTPFRELEL